MLSLYLLPVDTVYYWDSKFSLKKVCRMTVGFISSFKLKILSKNGWKSLMWILNLQYFFTEFFHTCLVHISKEALMKILLWYIKIYVVFGKRIIRYTTSTLFSKAFSHASSSVHVRNFPTGHVRNIKERQFFTLSDIIYNHKVKM